MSDSLLCLMAGGKNGWRYPSSIVTYLHQAKLLSPSGIRQDHENRFHLVEQPTASSMIPTSKPPKMVLIAELYEQAIKN